MILFAFSHILFCAQAFFTCMSLVDHSAWVAALQRATTAQHDSNKASDTQPAAIPNAATQSKDQPSLQFAFGSPFASNGGLLESSLGTSPVQRLDQSNSSAETPSPPSPMLPSLAESQDSVIGGGSNISLSTSVNTTPHHVTPYDSNSRVMLSASSASRTASDETLVRSPIKSPMKPSLRKEKRPHDMGRSPRKARVSATEAEIESSRPPGASTLTLSFAASTTIGSSQPRVISPSSAARPSLPTAADASAAGTAAATVPGGTRARRFSLSDTDLSGMIKAGSPKIDSPSDLSRVRILLLTIPFTSFFLYFPLFFLFSNMRKHTGNAPL